MTGTRHRGAGIGGDGDGFNYNPHPIGSMAWHREQRRLHQQQKQQHSFSHPVTPVAVPKDATHAAHQRYLASLMNNHHHQQQQQRNADSSTNTASTQCSLRDISILFGIPLGSLRKYNKPLLKLSNNDPIPSHMSIILGPTAEELSSSANEKRVKSILMLFVNPNEQDPTTFNSLAEEYKVPAKLLRDLNPEIVSPDVWGGAPSSDEADAARHDGGGGSGGGGGGEEQQPFGDDDEIPAKTKVRIPILHHHHPEGDQQQQQHSSEMFPKTSVVGSATIDNERFPCVTLLAVAHALGVRVDDLRGCNASLELLNNNDAIPNEAIPLAAPPFCYASHHQKVWRERIALTLSPPKPVRKATTPPPSSSASKKSPYFSVHSPMVLGREGKEPEPLVPRKSTAGEEEDQQQQQQQQQQDMTRFGRKELTPERLVVDDVVRGRRHSAGGPMVGFPFEKKYRSFEC